MTKLAQKLLDTAAQHGKRPALRTDDVLLSYTGFGDAAGRAAEGLRGRGVSRGDRIGVVLPNVPAVPDGWFRTGDLARRDADGYYAIVDRKKEMIIRGGCNVYPREVEEALYEHPAVAEAACIGVPHPDLGEEVAAAVALKTGASAEPDQLRAWVKERVAAHKYPRYVWLVQSLPKGPIGTILRPAVEAPADIVPQEVGA